MLSNRFLTNKLSQEKLLFNCLHLFVSPGLGSLLSLNSVPGDVNPYLFFYSDNKYTCCLSAYKRGEALASVAQWIEHGPVNQRVTGSIPSQGTCLVCRPGPQWGTHEKQPHIDVSLPLSFPSLLSKNE